MKNNGRLAIIILGYMAVLTAMAYLIFFICTWLYDRAEFPMGGLPASSEEVVSLKDGRLVMSQDSLDGMLKKAREEAMEGVQYEQEEALAGAADHAREEVLAQIRDRLAAGDSTMVEVLRPLYPEELVVVSGGKFHFVPINPRLKKNPYLEENLRFLENGECQYLEDGEVISHKGIDVSSHQGKIDWEKVAQDGVEFAIIRAGFRGYGSAGKLVPDNKFEDNIEGATKAGIKVAVYFFSQAINEEEVLEEAALVLEKLEPYPFKCPIVYDVEKTSSASGRMNQISLEERTNLALLFCQTVENAGYTPMIYHNLEMATLMIDIETFEKYDKWLAYYNSDLYYPYMYNVWQYSDKGSVDGIEGAVDMNICFDAFWEK